MKWTYYCYDHRDERATGPKPDSGKKKPVCPKCGEKMYWVAEGKTEPPEPLAVYGMGKRKAYGIGTRAGQR